MGIIAALSAASASCSGSGKTELAVDLVTDLRPDLDFSVVRTTVQSQGEGEVLAEASETVDADRSFRPDASRVAELAELPRGDSAVHVALLDATGATVVERTIRVRIQGSHLLRVTITSSCVDASCPGDGDPATATECLADRCVPPSCETFEDPSCGDPECTADADCTTPASCARGVCSEGACLRVPDDSSCGTGEYCDPVRGCTPLEPPACEPPLDDTFTVLEGDERGSGVTARPREAVAAFHGEHVWVVVTTTASLEDASVLVRVDCQGAREDPRVVLPDSVDPHIALAGERVAVEAPSNDGAPNRLVFLDRDSGGPLGDPIELPDTAWMSGIATRVDGGFDIMLQLNPPDSERAAALRTVDAAGAAVGEPRILRPEPTITQTRAVAAEGPGGTAAAFLRTDASSWIDEGVDVWMDSAGPVTLPSTDDRIMQMFPPSLVARGELLWAAVGPAGDGGIVGGETIDGRFVRLYSVTTSGSATLHELPSPPSGAGDYLADLVPLGSESLALLWVRRYEDGRDNEIYLRRIDPAAGGDVTAGPEVAVPTSVPVPWDEDVFTGADVGGDVVFVTWVEPLGSREPSAFRGRFVPL